MGESCDILSGDGDSTGESCVGTDDGFEDGFWRPLPVPESSYVNSMPRSQKAKRRIVNATMPRIVA